MPEAKRTSPWVWVAAGCGGALFLIVGCVVSLGYFGVRQVRQFEERMSDPEKRLEAALDVLNAEELPAGYYPLMSFSVPFVMDSVILTDREVAGGFDDRSPEALGERGFLYFKMLRFDRTEQRELRDFFEGRSDDPSVLRRSHINVDLKPRDRVANGELPNGDGQVLWVSHRADSFSHRTANEDALATMMLVECPGDQRTRFGILYGPDPAPEVAVGEADWSGTAADPGEVAAFASHFDFCAP